MGEEVCRGEGGGPGAWRGRHHCEDRGQAAWMAGLWWASGPGHAGGPGPCATQLCPGAPSFPRWCHAPRGWPCFLSSPALHQMSLSSWCPSPKSLAPPPVLVGHIPRVHDGRFLVQGLRLSSTQLPRHSRQAVKRNPQSHGVPRDKGGVRSACVWKQCAAGSGGRHPSAWAPAG